MSIRLMTRVWDDSKFKGTELLILLCLADHANDRGICWPSYDTLATRARCSRRQAIRCLLALKAEGWVSIIGKQPVGSGQFTNLWQIMVPDKRGEIMSPLLEADTERGDILAKRGDMEGKKGVTPMSPKPSGKPSIEPPLARLCRAQVSFPEMEEAHKHLLATTSLNDIHAVSCIDRWMQSATEVKDWKSELTTFAQGFHETF